MVHIRSRFGMFSRICTQIIRKIFRTPMWSVTGKWSVCATKTEQLSPYWWRNFIPMLQEHRSANHTVMVCRERAESEYIFYQLAKNLYVPNKYAILEALKCVCSFDCLCFANVSSRSVCSASEEYLHCWVKNYNNSICILLVVFPTECFYSGREIGRWMWKVVRENGLARICGHFRGVYIHIFAQSISE